MTKNIGGIVLCGGRSTRMGVPKALLPFGTELMLQRVVRLLGGVVQPIVVVAAAEQLLPELPPDIIVARDERQSQGPLEGLRVGLKAISGRADGAFVTSCDVPLLVPELIEKMIELLDDYDAVVPVEEKFHHPLAAVYRTSVVEVVEDLLAKDRLRPIFLFEQVSTREVNVEELRSVDPDLATLMNVNRPEDYFAALRRAGFAPTREIRNVLKVD